MKVWSVTSDGFFLVGVFIKGSSWLAFDVVISSSRNVLWEGPFLQCPFLMMKDCKPVFRKNFFSYFFLSMGTWLRYYWNSACTRVFTCVPFPYYQFILNLKLHYAVDDWRKKMIGWFFYTFFFQFCFMSSDVFFVLSIVFSRWISYMRHFLSVFIKKNIHSERTNVFGFQL